MKCIKAVKATLTLILFVLFFLTRQAICAPSPQVVSSSQVVSTSVSYKVLGKSKTKTIYCLEKVPGTVKSVSEGLLFTPVTTIIARLKAKKVTGVKLDTQIAIQKAGKKACSQLSQNPSSTPGASPTPTLSPGNFTGSGDVTPSGKIAFGIPSQLSANTSKGRMIVSSYCSCHGDKLGKKFPELRAAIALAPMYFDSNQITDQMLADITAHLNRYNLGF